MRAKDHVFEKPEDGFWYCMVGGREFGGWRFRDEAVGGMQVEQRRLRERKARERLTWDEGEVSTALAEAKPVDRDRFRMAFVYQLATFTESELMLQQAATAGSWGEADTPEKQAELRNGLALIDAVGAYRFGWPKTATTSLSPRTGAKVRAR